MPPVPPGQRRHRVPHTVGGQEHELVLGPPCQGGHLRLRGNKGQLRGPSRSLFVGKVAQCSRHGQGAFEVPAADGAVCFMETLVFPEPEGSMVLGAEGHSSRAAPHGSGVTAVCRVQKARGDD